MSGGGGGGWPSWVLEVSESPSAEQLSPREAERLEVAQTAHEQRIIVHARQATLREAVLQGQLRRVKAALRDHPEDVRGKDEHGRSAFWLAVLAGEAELLEVSSLMQGQISRRRRRAVRRRSLLRAMRGIRRSCRRC